MSSIKEEILKAIDKEMTTLEDYSGFVLKESEESKVVDSIYEIFKRHIEEAYAEGHDFGLVDGGYCQFDPEPMSKSEYLKSKGITE